MSETDEEKNPPSILIKFATAFTQAEAVVDKLTEDLKTAKAFSALKEKALVDEMITQQVKSFKTDLFGGFRTQAVVYPNVKDREALTAYVVKKKLKWLYTNSINGQKLRSYIKELIEQGKTIPPGIEPYTTTEIRRYK